MPFIPSNVIQGKMTSKCIIPCYRDFVVESLHGSIIQKFVLMIKTFSCHGQFLPPNSFYFQLASNCSPIPHWKPYWHIHHICHKNISQCKTWSFLFERRVSWQHHKKFPCMPSKWRWPSALGCIFSLHQQDCVVDFLHGQQYRSSLHKHLLDGRPFLIKQCQSNFLSDHGSLSLILNKFYSDWHPSPN